MLYVGDKVRKPPSTQSYGTVRAVFRSKDGTRHIVIERGSKFENVIDDGTVYTRYINPAKEIKDVETNEARSAQADPCERSKTSRDHKRTRRKERV